MRIQLLSFPGCPNAEAAREVLRRALVIAGLAADFEEVDVTAENAPEHLRNWGSPTILVDGNDVSGESPSGLCCRLYREGERTRGIPNEAAILDALKRASYTKR